MIRFSIEGQKEECKEPVQELRIGLRISDKSIDIVSLQENGTVNWYLLRLHPDGTFSRVDGVSDGIGFQLNDDGQIVEREN